eukprot:TRINITY_DN2514_c1_g1_i1.p2 TRINITY_DN2514_c1_g1~~TRINITY_DN2514_c1_g1_i1.p2  ORF type:complete len:705 (+),score=362.34 TRINITY_DN2514_c1_g1_i1:25-2139(+)
MGSQLSFLALVVVGAVSAAVLSTLIKVPKKGIKPVPSQQSKVVDGATPATGEGLPRQHIIPFPEEKYINETVFSFFKKATAKYAKKNCLGARPFVAKIKEEKVINGVTKTWEFLQLGAYEWFTYEQVYNRVLNLGAGLRKLGLKQGDFFGVYEDTRMEWTLIENACFSQGIILTTVYANLGEEAVIFGVNETEMSAIMTNGSLLKVIAGAADKCASIKYVVYTDEADAAAKATLEAKGIKVYSFADVEELGLKNFVEPNPSKPTDTAVVMYTSGSTGTPKGVTITNSNLVAAMQQTFLATYLEILEDDIYISFLPLAHVLALTAEGALMALGVSIGYGNPRSLTDSAVRNCNGDLTELKPTLMAGVPTVYDRIKKAVREKIQKSGPITQTLFNFAYAYKKSAVANNMDTPIFNKIIFDKMRAQLGGNMRLLLSGGAPLSVDSHEFLRVCFGTIVIQGYGLTETCGGGNLMNVNDPGYEHIGPPLPGIEMKLVDVEEMGYKSTDKPHPRGEIWIKGPNVATRGYYKSPKKTAEEFPEGGWFKTGDVGMWTDSGSITIIDRVKNLVKLSHGEYVALESLESKFKASPLVDSICVVADSSKPCCVALVVPSQNGITEWAEKNGIANASDFEAVCKNPKAKDVVLQSIVTVARSSKMKSFEIPRAVHLCTEEWTPANGMLTAAMKLKRQNITAEFDSAIKEMYTSVNE